MTSVVGVIPVDAFIFDLDGTLIDSKLDLAHAVNAALTTAGRRGKPVEEIAGYIGDGVRNLLMRSLETEEPEAIEGALTVFRAHYREHCLDHTRLYPGVRETLEHFRDKAQAVVSNKPEEFSRMIIDQLGLGARIAVVIGGGSTPALKPDPAPVRLALERLGKLPQRAVLVGDGITDIEAGRRAGMRTCAVTYGLGDASALALAEPDHIVHRFAQLCDLFE